jgi:hypothetical protein
VLCANAGWIPDRTAPESGKELNERILQIGSLIEEAIRGQYVSILVAGGAARGESTFGPEGLLLSDVDFYIVLPQANGLTAWLAARDCRAALRKILPWLDDQNWITVGFGYRMPRFWNMATPFMLELKTNARVIAGSESALKWPHIESGSQIPRWEGLRLIGNRMCELIGWLGKSAGGTFPPAGVPEDWIVAYKCIKLILACSEAILIDARRYAPSYRERMRRHREHVSGLDPSDEELILAAYRAKLNDNPAVYRRPSAELAERSLRLVFSVLPMLGIDAPIDWLYRARSESPGAPGWVTDIVFYIGQSVRARRVPVRRAIGDVYREAHLLAVDLSRRLSSQSPVVFPADAYRRVGRRFQETPQFVGVVRAQGGNG